MPETAPQPAEQAVIYRSDYQVPVYHISETNLLFELDEKSTQVTSTLLLNRNADSSAAEDDLVLDGENIELVSVAIDGNELGKEDYRLGENKLIILSPPKSFSLRIVTIINPAGNLALEGLYLSDGMFCTQCEAEGFRRITYYLDRPDVMSVFSVKIIADEKSYPVLLSNGNRKAEGKLENGKHWVEWHDPYKKPSYLFALVAGDLCRVEDTFTTMSGRDVDLHIYVEEKDLDKCAHAMLSLKNAMAWDEKEYGREYDLDLYMIVAVDFFNMGAMENKGLNIFNTSCVLAHPGTQTDAAFQRVEAVIAHEYFHNWSGNRVTCRDWFQLSLKEGFTVFRDASFSADMNSAGVKRIENVNLLRSAQFAEDAGPMAHPIRPDSFIEISNFYTLTIYEKGAEVIRMMQRLLGPDAFRRGCDLYFDRHDGQAVTCEDFVVAMEDASGTDLSQFRHWYSQAGTPELTVTESWDDSSKTYTLDVEQYCGPSPGQPHKEPFFIPVEIALLTAEENNRQKVKISEQLIVVTEQKQQFRFPNQPSRPLPAMLRGFSAPVKLHFDYSDEQLLFLMKHEVDGFTRWDASRRYLISIIKNDISGDGLLSSAPGQQKIQQFTELIIDLLRQGIRKPHNADECWNEEIDAAMLAELITLPSYALVLDEFEVVDVQKLIDSMLALQQEYSRSLAKVLFETYSILNTQLKDIAEYRPVASDIGLRSLKNVCLRYLMDAGEDTCVQLADEQFRSAANMSDQFAALQALVQCRSKSAVLSDVTSRALADFYQQWRNESLVVNQWFNVQAAQNRDDTLLRVRELQKHAAYDSANPNKVRALIGGFSNLSPHAFHASDGSGYSLLTEEVLRLDTLNPQLASRLLTPLTKWQRFAEPNRSLMLQALHQIREKKNLSSDVYEVVTKTLNQES